METYGNFWETVSICVHRGDEKAIHRRERRELRENSKFNKIDGTFMT